MVPPPLQGRLEWLSPFGLAGWARRGAAPVRLEVSAGDELRAVVDADAYRPDLALAGEGDGAHGFEVWFDPPLEAPSVVRVACADGAALPGTPALLPAPAPPPPGALRPDGALPLVLVLDEAAPDAARDAGSAALLSHLTALRQLGFAVAFAPAAEAAALIARTAGLVRVAYLHRLRPMLDWHASVRAANSGVRILFALADLASLRAARRARVLGGTVPAGLAAAEAAAFAAADAVLTYSAAEQAELARRAPGLAVFVVPWAVEPAPVGVAFGRRAGVGFFGNFGHAPNLDAAQMLLRAVMPRLWRRGPVPCVIAGYAPPAELRAAAGPLVEVVASPREAASVWERVRVSAAPLRFGAGVKGKVLDSLAAGTPCVCSPVAAEGIALPEGLLAATAEAMAAALWRLHEDEAANAAAAAAGLAMIARSHAAGLVRARLADALDRRS